VVVAIDARAGNEGDARGMNYSDALGSWVVRWHVDALAMLRREALEIFRSPHTPAFTRSGEPQAVSEFNDVDRWSATDAEPAPTGRGGPERESLP